MIRDAMDNEDFQTLKQTLAALNLTDARVLLGAFEAIDCAFSDALRELTRRAFHAGALCERLEGLDL